MVRQEAHKIQSVKIRSIMSRARDRPGRSSVFALAAGRAMYDFEEDAEVIARRSLTIAAEICVYTNGNMTVESING